MRAEEVNQPVSHHVSVNAVLNCFGEVGDEGDQVGFGVQFLGNRFLLEIVGQREVGVVNQREHLVQLKSLLVGDLGGLEQGVEVLALEGNLLDRLVHHAPRFHNKRDLILVVLALFGQHFAEQLVRANVQKTLNVVAGSQKTRLGTQGLPGIEPLEQLPLLLFGEVVEVGHAENDAVQMVLQGFGKLAELHA